MRGICHAQGPEMEPVEAVIAESLVGLDTFENI